VNEYLNFTTSKNKYGSADSAVAVYFNPKELSAGDTRIYETFYGIGSVSDTVNSDDKLSVQITAPQKLSLNSTKDGYADSSNPFEMNVTVTN
ncbi:hypothetical protein, partial [Salmonella enterica]|uniref:hypothetical protein n=1 Tax=Salmonella enterica TaxID=28901 RepID=UPI0020C3C4D1